MSSITDPIISIYSIVLTSCSCLTPHSCVSHSCTHCLAVFLLVLPISLTNAQFPDSVYKTVTMYVIQYVWILILTIVFIVYSTSGHPNIILNFWTLIPNIQKYSSLIWNSMLSYIKAMFCSRLISELLDTDSHELKPLSEPPPKSDFQLSSAVH